MQQSPGPAAVVRLISAPLPPLVRYIIFVLEQDSKHVSLSGQIRTSSASKGEKKNKKQKKQHFTGGKGDRQRGRNLLLFPATAFSLAGST